MDFSLSKEQKMIQSSVREYLAKECPPDRVRELQEDERGYAPEMWKKMASLGWMGIIFSEDYNIIKEYYIDLMIIMEEMGRRLLLSPFLSTIVLCALPISEFGNDEQKEKYLPSIVDGGKIWTLALTETSVTFNSSEIKLNATLEGEDFLLSGNKMFVPYAHVADYLLVVARTRERGITVFIVDSKSSGLIIELIPTAAHDKQCEVTFDKVRVSKKNILSEVGKGWDVVNFILQRGAVLKSAEMLGGAQAVLEMTNDYAKKRIQFGRPIGSFQAIQHKLVDLFCDIDGLRYLIYEAGWEISIGLISDLLISMAKARANEVYQRTCIESIKIHGAIGFTRDQDIGLYYLRTKSSEFVLGDTDFHKGRIAIELGSYASPLLALR